MTDYRDYSNATPPFFAAGDLVAFEGYSPVSNLIKFATWSRYSHVGVVALVRRADLLRATINAEINGSKFDEKIINNWTDRLMLFESTTLNGEPCELTGRLIRGVQAHNPWNRIASYPGRVWRLPLAADWVFDQSESEHCTQYLLGKLGIEYDEIRAAGAAGWALTRWLWNPEDWSRSFCSQLDCGVFKRLGRFPIENCNKVSPASMVNRSLDLGFRVGPIVVKA